jgi:hypothetical protein
VRGSLWCHLARAPQLLKAHLYPQVHLSGPRMCEEGPEQERPNESYKTAHGGGADEKKICAGGSAAPARYSSRQCECVTCARDSWIHLLAGPYPNATNFNRVSWANWDAVGFSIGLQLGPNWKHFPYFIIFFCPLLLCHAKTWIKGFVDFTWRNP